MIYKASRGGGDGVNHPREGGCELESKVVHSVQGAQIGQNRQVAAPRDGILQRKTNTATKRICACGGQGREVGDELCLCERAPRAPVSPAGVTLQSLVLRRHLWVPPGSLLITQ